MSTSSTTKHGLITLRSTYTVRVTANKVEDIAKAKGMNVIARINHAAGAEKIGETLRPTELVIFGNPQAGTPLMQSQQSAAIDLPQKILVWESEDGKVWLAYNDPVYLAKRHGIEDCDELVNRTSLALKNIAQEAVE